MTFEVNSWNDWLLGIDRIQGHEIEPDGSQGAEVKMLRVGLGLITITLYL